MLEISLNEVKYEDAILALLEALGGRVRGKKKLAKLLYFVDFDFYEQHERPVTGETYYARDMGPLGINLQGVLTRLEESRRVKITTEQQGELLEPTHVYSLAAESGIKALSDEELRMIKRVAEKYGMLTGKQLEHLAHSEAPHVGTEPGQRIPYEFAFYRGTEFGSNA